MKENLDILLQEYVKNQINLYSSTARNTLIEEILKIVDNYYKEDKIDR